MGCDIHMVVEHYWYDWAGDGEKKRWMLAIGEEGAYGDRNYDLFRVLAGVRDYTDGLVKPIAKPRGLPSDVSPEVLAWHRNGSDFHSTSYLTLREILQYPWEEKLPESGLVSAVEYERMLREGEPNGWCQGRGGTQVTEEEMKALLKKHPVSDELLAKVKADPYFGDMRIDHALKNHYTHATWKRKPSCDGFLEWVRALRNCGVGRYTFNYNEPTLRADPEPDKKKAQEGRPGYLPGTDVRLVFAFDN